MVVDTLAGVDFEGLVPGSHVVLLSASPMGSVQGRRMGFEVRDTVLVLGRAGARFGFLLRKPVEGTLVNTVLKYGTGALWVDGCRVRTEDDYGGGAHMSSSGHTVGVFAQTHQPGELKAGHALGRWPSNLVLVHGPGCRRVGTRKVQAPAINRFTDGMKPWGDAVGSPYERTEGGIEEIAVYDCEQLCPAKGLNDQTESLKTRGNKGASVGRKQTPVLYGPDVRNSGAEYNYGDEGGAARFFPQFETEAEMRAWLLRLVAGEQK